jgi:hypothetical protein
MKPSISDRELTNEEFKYPCSKEFDRILSRNYSGGVDWAVITWRCPHRHRFYLAKWLCVRLHYLLLVIKGFI